MAGFISNFFGVGDSDSQYEEPTEASQAAAPTESATNTRSTPKVVPMQGGKSVNSKIALFEPKIYSDVKEIATQLLKNQAVIINFDHVDDEMARRIVDFDRDGFCHQWWDRTDRWWNFPLYSWKLRGFRKYDKSVWYEQIIRSEWPVSDDY